MEKIKAFFADEQNIDKIVPFLSVLLGFIVGAVVIILSGDNPFEAYAKLFQGAFGSIKKIGDTLLIMTTITLTGLSVAFAFRTGLFNIGASGQLLIGGFVAVLIGVNMELPKIIHLPLAVLAAIVAGALWAAIPGALKAVYNIHEVVTTIMMNWIAVWTVYYFIPIFAKGAFDTESARIAKSASLRVEWLTDLFNGSVVNLGFFLAIIAAVVVWFILEKTTFGFELKAVGFNKDAAKYAGIKVNRNMIYSMMIAGALAGLAGATFYLGYTDNIKIGELPNQGFTGIAVSLLGMNSPIGVVLSSFLFGFMDAGKGFMRAAVGVPQEITQIIMAVIIFFAAANLMVKKWLKKLVKSAKKGGEGNV